MAERDRAPVAKLLIRFPRSRLDWAFANPIARTTRNWSRNVSDAKPLTGFAAVSTFIVARNARASLMGRVGAFCNEKS